MENLIDIKELAERLKVGIGTLYNWVSQGRIPVKKLGRCVRFDWQEIEAEINAKRLGRFTMRSAR